jgi:hypothetical protein
MRLAPLWRRGGIIVAKVIHVGSWGDMGPEYV